MLRHWPRLLFASFLLCAAAEQAIAAGEAGGWETAAPEAVGLDAGKLSALARDIGSGKFSNIHSLIVVRHGKLAFEQYFQGPDEHRGEAVGLMRFDKDTLHDMRSVTKSVTAILFGIALAGHAIKSADTPVLDYFPEYASLRTPQKAAIRLRDLLSMTSGLQWDEEKYPYSSPLNSEIAMDRAPDRYRYVLEQPVAAEPGTTFNYSGGDTALLAAVIERATKMRLDDYAEQALFRPLGITRYEWLKDATGTPIAASGLRLLPRDAAKLGLLYLQKGRWNGAQIVPESWVEASLSPHANISPRPFGFQRYGYQWWLGTARVNDAAVPFAAAVGWGGQRILIVPSMDLVAVLTAGLYAERRQTDTTFAILLDGVLPAVKP
jgi:CubicO group peptidase (beta-lactamase class C family)